MRFGREHFEPERLKQYLDSTVLNPGALGEEAFLFSTVVVA